MSDLTAAEERQIITMLRNLGQARRASVLASVENFLNWLRQAAQHLWNAIRNTIRSIWDSIVDFFF